MKSIENLYHFFEKSTGICTDTRKLEKGNVFFALKGPNFDGNRYAESALENGAILAVVDDQKLGSKKDCFLVEDVLSALQQLALFHRKQLNIPIIGITGSNGKTSTKELLAVALSAKYNVFSTKGNLNNHIGVPLSLLSIKLDHEIAIIEMGANHVGEIESYCKWALPDYGLITNIGTAHLEGFGGVEGIIKGKTELYHSVEKRKGLVFYNAASTVLSKKVKELSNKISYGFTEDVDFSFQLISANPSIEMVYGANKILSPMFARYNAINIAAATSVALYFKVDIKAVATKIAQYNPDNNRSQIVNWKNNTVILDAYNANPTSVALSLESFAERTNKNKVAILGDMFELGNYAEKEHKKILILADRLQIDNLVVVGTEFHKHKNSFPNITFFQKTIDAKEWLQNCSISDSIILLKGSRSMQLENLIEG